MTGWSEVAEPRASHGRSFRAIAEAFEEAAGRSASYPELIQALSGRQREIDRRSAALALQCLVILGCRKSGETPRSLLEDAFVRAPSDEYWRAAAGVRG